MMEETAQELFERRFERSWVTSLSSADASETARLRSTAPAFTQKMIHLNPTSYDISQKVIRTAVVHTEYISRTASVCFVQMERTHLYLSEALANMMKKSPVVLEIQ
jgi:hypothetical protein